MSEDRTIVVCFSAFRKGAVRNGIESAYETLVYYQGGRKKPAIVEETGFYYTVDVCRCGRGSGKACARTIRYING